METFLNAISNQPLAVIDTAIPFSAYVPIQINSSNTDLANFDISASAEWETYLHSYLANKNAKVAFGGYLETRDIYKRSTYFEAATEKRNIHLGIDLWCAAETRVLAVLDGEIHSFQNNKNFGDYGPTIIVKHKINEVEFYTLYGHLSERSLEDLYEGKTVKKGEVIAQLGESCVNGDYAPHLHFQVIKDMQGKKGDYPGVCAKSMLSFYQENCPDPNLLLKLHAVE